MRLVHCCCWVFALTGVGVVLSTDARGCTPWQGPAYAVGATAPGDGSEEVKLNAGLRFEGEVFEANGRSGFQLVEVQVTRQGSEAVVPGRILPWRATEPILLWVPDEPLAPHSGYQVYTLSGPGGDFIGDEADSILRTSEFSFTTGDEEFSQLAFEGELEIELETFEQAIPEPGCLGACGSTSNCATEGTRTALRAVVSLPHVAGGNAQHGYSATFTFSQDRPPPPTEIGAGFSPDPEFLVLAQQVFFQADERLQLTQPLPEPGVPYAPCFSLQVWDTGGQSARQTKCLETLDVNDWIIADEGTIAEGSPATSSTDAGAKTDLTHASADEGRPRHAVGATDTSCMLASGRRSSSSAGFSLTLIALMLSRRRRRRER